MATVGAPTAAGLLAGGARDQIVIGRYLGLSSVEDYRRLGAIFGLLFIGVMLAIAPPWLALVS
jgi:hypothetical protein